MGNQIKDFNFTAIIPFYNEGVRIFPVLDSLAKVQEISQIICVDDGSFNDTFNLIKERYPLVEAIKLKSNQGKSAAIEKGLKRAKFDHLFLVDADLINLEPEVIKKAILKMKNDSSADMIVLRQVNFLPLARLVRADVLVSGQRFLRKKELSEIFKKYRPRGYQLELVSNQYMLENRKQVYWLKSRAICPPKIEKFGFLKGTVLDSLAVLKIVSCVGFFNWLKQVLIFARKEAA